MEILNKFIISLVTAIIFITAIELVGPDNDMKKYLKFVMGLILVAIILNPIVEVLTKGEGYLTRAVLNYTDEITSKTKDEVKNDDNSKIREDSFKKNFNKNCESTLNEKFLDFTFKSDVDCKVDFNNMTMEVNSLKIYAKPKGVRKVEKVTLGEEKENDDEIKVKIKEFLSKELNIDKNKIKVNYE